MQRKPNIVMAVFALIAGGGETFPIMLANLLHKRGYGVTIFNCNLEETEPGVRRMIASSIPVIEMQRVYFAGKVFSDMGVEVVHSHHASVDLMLMNLLATFTDIKRIITLHGMYDLMPPAQLRNVMRKFDQRIDCFVYTAEKNLVPFSADFRVRNIFVKIPNALAPTPIHPVSRVELGVDENDFVLCLVSRAIPAKGWQEGIEAVSWANKRSSRPIHLLLIGEGPESDRLNQSSSPDYIHYLGFKRNIRDYFAAADMGFLPSRFKGESFPLVVIDCIFAGKPVLASNVGEIKKMLWTEAGLAGEVFDLMEWKIPVQAVGGLILSLANSPDKYEILLERTTLAAKKFDPAQMLDSYESVYQTCLNSERHVKIQSLA
jgi:glycosyltransferase involved in cell wall biosynthesis